MFLHSVREKPSDSLLVHPCPEPLLAIETSLRPVISLILLCHCSALSLETSTPPCCEGCLMEKYQKMRTKEYIFSSEDKTVKKRAGILDVPPATMRLL